jgi:AhpD family alkylhydroperoxidase
MARIPYRDSNGAPERVKELLAKNKGANIFRMMSHAEAAFEPYLRLGNALLFKGELDPKLREMAIVRVGQLCGAPYEVVAHEKIAANAGLAADKIAAIGEGSRAKLWMPIEREVLRLAEEMVTMKRGAPGTVETLYKGLGPRALTELVMSIGYYMLTSTFLETLGIDMEAELKLPEKRPKS